MYFYLLMIIVTLLDKILNSQDKCSGNTVTDTTLMFSVKGKIIVVLFFTV